MGKLKLLVNPISPYSARVLIAVAFKGIDCEIEYYDTVKDKERVKETMNPSGTVPVLTLEDGTHLYESMALVEYLDSLPEYADKPKLFPTDPVKRVQVYMNISRLDTINTRIGKMMKGEVEQALTGLEDDLKIFDEIIGDSKFLSGDQLGISDVNFFPWINRMMNIPPFKEQFEKDATFMVWYERVLNHEAVEHELGKVNPEWWGTLGKNVQAGKPMLIWPVRDLTEGVQGVSINQNWQV